VLEKSYQITFNEPVDQVIVLNHLHDIAYMMCRDPTRHRFKPEFVNAYACMLNQLVLVNDADLEALAAQLARGLKIILGPGSITNALFTGPVLYSRRKTQPSHYYHGEPNYGHSLGWWRALRGDTDPNVPLLLAAAMAVRNYKFAQYLLQHLSDENTHVVFGSPLLNAIKLRDLKMVQLVINNFGRFDKYPVGGAARAHLFLQEMGPSFPIIAAIQSAISHDHVDIIEELLGVFLNNYGVPSNQQLNAWLEVAAEDAGIRVLNRLLAIRPTDFKLGFKAVVAICQTGEYDMVYHTFATLDHPEHRSSAHDPLHIAVRSGLLDTVMAMVNTQRYNINAEVNSNISSYSTGKITALDVALHHGFVPIIKYLAGLGAYATQHPPFHLKGRVYKYVREASLRRNGGRFTHLPPYGNFKDMSSHDRELLVAC
jgi:hypothetical protein